MWLSFFPCPPYGRMNIEVWVCGYELVAQSCPTLCDPMDCNPPAPLSMAFSRQELWSGLPCSSPGDLPDPGIEPSSLASQADSLPSELPGKPKEPECPILMYHIQMKGQRNALCQVWGPGPGDTGGRAMAWDSCTAGGPAASWWAVSCPLGLCISKLQGPLLLFSDGLTVHIQRS